MTNIAVNIEGGFVEDSEIEAYVKRAAEKYPDKQLHGIDINVNGDYVELTYYWKTVPYERIRRIR